MKINSKKLNCKKGDQRNRGMSFFGKINTEQIQSRDQTGVDQWGIVMLCVEPKSLRKMDG